MRKNKLIVFDIDGTLTDSVKEHQKAFTEMLLEIGVKEISSEFKSFKHHTDLFIAKEIYEKTTGCIFSKETYKQFEKGLTEKINAQKFKEIKGATQLIENLRTNSSYEVCFATGSLRRPAEHKLKSVGISFEDWQLVSSDYIEDREGIVNQAIEQTKSHCNVSKFEQIISVGDGLWDLVTAKNLNLDFIGVGNLNKDILIQHGAKVVCKDLSEFEDKVVRINTM